MNEAGGPDDALSREAGMTLIELIVSVIILAVIVGPLTAAMIVILRSTNQTDQRSTAFHDRNLVRTYVPNDLISAVSSPVQTGLDNTLSFVPSLTTVDDNSTKLCDGTKPYGATGKFLFSVTWGEYTYSSTSGLGFNFTAYEADYYTAPGGTGGYQLQTPSTTSLRLMRTYCSGANTVSPSAIINTLTIADDFAGITASQSSSGSVTTLTISTSGPGTPDTSQHLQCVSGDSAPCSISTISVTIPDPSGTGNCSATSPACGITTGNQTYSFQATRRAT